MSNETFLIILITTITTTYTALVIPIIVGNKHRDLDYLRRVLRISYLVLGVVVGLAIVFLMELFNVSV